MSIALAAGVIEQHLIGGVAVETDDSAALTSTTVDFQANTMTWVFSAGSRANGALTPGQRVAQVTIVLNLVTGVWTNPQTGATGTVANGIGGPLTQLNNGLRTLRNGIETAGINQGIFTGTQVPW